MMMAIKRDGNVNGRLYRGRFYCIHPPFKIFDGKIAENSASYYIIYTLHVWELNMFLSPSIIYIKIINIKWEKKWNEEKKNEMKQN